MGQHHREQPDHTHQGWPPGIAYIIGNEGCERFSFYGMRSVLFIHLAALHTSAGVIGERAKDLATADVHLFIMGVYALPVIGAILADRYLGKYLTIMALSLVYCGGHAVLSAGEESLVGSYLGLGLIAIGAGGIKPCVSAHVGDQFGRGNWFRLRRAFQWFYFIINFGSAFATILIPWTYEAYGPGVAFGIPGVLMFLATLFFWLGRHRFVHIPPRPGGRVGLLDAVSSTAIFLAFGHLFVTHTMPWWTMLGATAGFLAVGLYVFARRQRLEQDDGFLAIMLWILLRGRNHETVQAPVSSQSDKGDDPLGLRTQRFWASAVHRFGVEAVEGPVAVLKIMSTFFLILFFWALFDQQASSWIRQTEAMYLPRLVELPLIGGVLGLFVDPNARLLPSQLPALNPFMVMVLIPFMNQVYRLSEKFGIKTPALRRMTVGMLVAALSFVAAALIQTEIDRKGPGIVHALWQVVPYLIITVAEVMVSITGLEFAYTQAPKRMKSTIMSFWLLTVTLGNFLVALFALLALDQLPLAQFFWVFAGLMALAAILFGVRARFYRQHDYPQ